ncbi:MAG: hypothetical protein KDA38_03105, partial [Planctomycetales bacterium]|nr:hypothetical protein [Planctomycetales bacterium]
MRITDPSEPRPVPRLTTFPTAPAGTEQGQEANAKKWVVRSVDRQNENDPTIQIQRTIRLGFRKPETLPEPSIFTATRRGLT